MLRSESQEPCALRSRQLAQMRLATEGLEVSYRLLETAEGYLIEVALGEEATLLFLEGTSTKATYVYERLIKGSVTPCTAADVWEDMQKGNL